MSSGERTRRRPGPGGAEPGGSDDGLERQRALTGEFREALDAFAEDAREIVRDEVSRASPDLDALEHMVRRVARDELHGWEVRHRQAGSRTALAVVSVLALLVSAAGWGVVLWGRGEGTPAVEPVEAAVAVASPAPVPDGASIAARFDSLFAARDSSLVVLAERVLPLSTPRLSAAVAAWRTGDAAQDRVLHDALVQLALREVVDSTVAVDGAVVRTPACSGQSCSALLVHWRSRAGSGGYPALPAEPASDSAGLALVERLLVMELVDP